MPDLNSLTCLKKVSLFYSEHLTKEAESTVDSLVAAKTRLPKKRLFRGKVRTPGSIAPVEDSSRLVINTLAKPPSYLRRDRRAAGRKKEDGMSAFERWLSASVKCRRAEVAVPARYTRGADSSRGRGREKTADLVAFAGPFTIL